jgi:2-succinyl-6-hydroxy-2,4-cyclohexadiene-1-carboxylate synthase
MLHGFTNTGASWTPVIEALAQRYRPIAPDIRGHGPEARRPVSLELVLDDLAELAPERFTLAGYSMGGRIALHAALAMPERVERLALIGASPGLADAGERAARREADQRLASEIERSEIGSFAARWAQTPVLGGISAELAAAAYVDRIRSSPGALADALRALGTGELAPVWDRLGELAMPVALVVGERDAKFRAIALEMAAAIPRASVEVVPGAGHAVHIEAPEAVAALLLGV